MTTDTPTTHNLPAPGYYPDVDDPTYRSWPAASQSILKILATKSAAHAKYAIDHPPEPSDAMRFGTAVHMAALQPERFAETYQIATPCEALTGKGVRCGAATAKPYKPLSGADEPTWLCGRHCKAHAGREISDIETLSAEDHARVICTASAMTTHATGRRLFAGLTHRELPIVWRDDASGLDCKALVDGLGELTDRRTGRSITFAMDIKTCRDAEINAFEKSIFTGGYFMQAAHYMVGLASVGLPVESFIFVAVESVPPHGVKLYRMEDEVIETGRQLLAGIDGDEESGAYHRMAKCLRDDIWPSYDPYMQDIGLPNFAFRQLFRGDN